MQTVDPRAGLMQDPNTGHVYARERPPYARFERRAVARRRTVEEGGAEYYVEVDFAVVTAQGSKDTVEKVVSEWFAYMKQMQHAGRLNPEWLPHYERAYAQWKETNEVPLNGMPVANWPVATASEVKILRQINIHTVEDLAACTEEALQRIGMGARSLKQRAQDWITAKQDTAPLIARLDALAIAHEAQTKTLQTLSEQNRILAAQLALRQPAGTVEVSRHDVAAAGEEAADVAMDSILGK